MNKFTFASLGTATRKSIAFTAGLIALVVSILTIVWGAAFQYEESMLSFLVSLTFAVACGIAVRRGFFIGWGLYNPGKATLPSTARMGLILRAVAVFFVGRLITVALTAIPESDTGVLFMMLVAYALVYTAAVLVGTSFGANKAADAQELTSAVEGA